MEIKEILEKNQKTYDLIANEYQYQFKDEIEKKKFDRDILDLFSKKICKNNLILDLGCGSSGHVGSYLHKLGHEVIGIDLSPKSVRLASELHPKMEFKQMNMLHLSFENGSICGIVAFYSIIHIPKSNLDSLFREFYRVLDQGGYLLFSVHEGYEEKYMDEILGIKTEYFVSFFTKYELQVVLQNNNFNIEFIKVRKPYEFEYQSNRIYVLARKM